MEAVDVIKEGDHVIFDEHGEKKSIHVILPNGRAKVGKFHVSVSQLIGAPWGSTYKLAVDGSKLLPVTEHESQLGPVVDEIAKDNSTLVDANHENQNLTQEDIAAMAASGKAGDDIIAALCSNSATFHGKTEFAQEKYKKRKARKYSTRLTLRKPTAWTMCEVMFDKAPTGIWNLRPDSLSLLLSLANVAAHSRVLLLENTQGLLAAACAERLGGHGVLCCVGTGGRMTALSGLRQLNLGQRERGIVSCVQLGQLKEAAQRLAAGGQQQSNKANGASSSQQQQQQQEPSAAAAAAAEPPPPAAAAEPTAAAKPDSNADAAAEPMAVDIEDKQSRPSLTTAVAAVPVVAAAVAIAPTAADHDEIMALYDNLSEDGDDATAAAAAKPKSPKHRAKKQRSGPPEQQQQQQGGSSAGAAADAGVPQQQQQQGEGDGAGTRNCYTATPEQLDQMLRQGFTSCIIAAPRLQAISILEDVLPLLQPSASFAVFSPWMQPLAEAMQQLTTSKRAVMLQLQESWLRPYQVLPGRTHPHMNMTTGGTGGYIMSGITVAGGSGDGGGAEQGGESGRGRGRGGGAPRGGKRGRRQR